MMGNFRTRKGSISMVSYRNKPYESEQELCQVYQYSYSEFERLKGQGMALPEIMITLAPTNSRVIVYDGVAYANLTDFCNTLGLDYYRFRSKFNATGDMALAVEHARTPSVTRGNIKINGETFHSYVELCRKYHISYASFMNYVHSKNKTPQEAFDACMQRTSKAHPVAYKGKQYPSILALCRDYDWNYSLMSKLLKAGVSVEAAARKCDEDREREEKPIQTVIYHGEVYRSLHALAREKGITYSALHTMISHGKEMEAAVDELIRRKETRNNRPSLRNSIEVKVNGKTYHSIKQALDENNINLTSYYARKAAHPERTPEELLAELTDPEKFRRRNRNQNRVFTINGEIFGTQQEVYRDFGLAPSAVANVMRAEKKSFEEAVTAIVDRRERGLTEPDGSNPDTEAMIVCGHRFPSVTEVIERFELKEEDIIAYMDEHHCKRRDAIRGLAKEVSPEPIERRAYIIDGLSFPNKNSVYKHFGISAYSTAQCMARYNISFEEAVLYLRDAAVKKSASGANIQIRCPVNINGVPYASVNAALQHLGFSPSVFYDRKKRDPELTDQQILEDMVTEGSERRSPNNAHSFQVNGQTFPNKQSCLTAYNLSRHDVCMYMRKHTVSFEEAILALAGKRQQQAGTPTT